MVTNINHDSRAPEPRQGTLESRRSADLVEEKYRESPVVRFSRFRCYGRFRNGTFSVYNEGSV